MAEPDYETTAEEACAAPGTPEPPEIVEPPTVVVRPKARAKRAPKKPEPIPEPVPPPPEPVPEPKRRKPAPKSKAEPAPKPNPEPKVEREEDTPFSTLARALHNARQNYASERQMLYQSFVHG